MIKINDLLSDRYKIVSELGHGGMSDVYEARDIIFRREVAIKMIKFENASKIENLIRFQNEARFSAAFNHPNIVKIYDYGEYNNLPYIVNEYMKSQTLRDILDYKGSFSLKETCQIMLQLCDAVATVHAKNIVHRDIKPQNIYYTNDGTVKLSDFGISILLNSSMNINENKKVMGTVQYLAPELVCGKKSSFQSDIYAVGITMFELLAGEVPFDGKKPSDIALMQVNDDVPSILKYIPSLPPEVDEVIKKATAKELKNRYKSILEFKEDVSNLMKNKKAKKTKNGFFKRLFRRTK